MDLIVQTVFVLLCVVEAVHDKYVIDLQNYAHPQYNKLSSGWHRMSALYYCGVAATVALLIKSIWVFPILMLIRLAFFNAILNIIRDKPVFYLSNSGFDATMKKILGPSAGMIQFLGAIALIVLLNIYT